MHDAPGDTQLVGVEALGEHLSGLRLCDAEALAAMRRSLETHGQLSALVVFSLANQFEIIDGFKRVRAARALRWETLTARVVSVGSVDAKLRVRELHEGRGFTELEEAWLVRSLYREDHLTLPAIAQLLSRHKSWVWRRLMLVESLETSVQTDVRLGLIAPRAAVALSRLPRGNQQGASLVVVRRGLTVRQTEMLVEELLQEPDDAARAVLIIRRVDVPAGAPPGPRPLRATRAESDWMSNDILRLLEISARLQARLLGSPLETFTPAAAELIRDALIRLRSVLRALDEVIGAAIGQTEAA
jgi:ParB-like chromosome segregation protein Spo0J